MTDVTKKNQKNFFSQYLSVLSEKITKLYTIYLIPVLILIGLWGYLVFRILTENSFSSEAGYFTSKVIFVLSIWALLALGLAHLNQKFNQQIQKYVLLGLQVFAVIIPLAYVLLLPSQIVDFDISFGIVGGVMILVSIIWALTSQFILRPLSQYKNINQEYSFEVFSWQYLWQLFLNLVLVGVVTTILFIAITIIPASLSILFDLQVDGKVYSIIFVTAYVLIGELIYLSEFPSAADIHTWFGHRDTENKGNFRFPRILSVALPYIGLPIVTIYSIILNSFVVYIFVTGNWPKEGVIYYMISLISSIIVIIMGLEPQLIKNTRLRMWSRILYALALPPFGAYFYGIFIRIGDQGVTANRYFVVLIGLGLLIITLNNLINKVPKFTVSLLTVVILSLVTILGPIGLVSTVVSSQSSLTEEKLESLNILSNGVLQTDKKINEEDSLFLSTRFSLLEDYNQLDEIAKYLDSTGQQKFEDFKEIMDKRYSPSDDINSPIKYDETGINSSYSEAEWLIRYLGGTYQLYSYDKYGGPDPEFSNIQYISASQNSVQSISGYSLMYKVNSIYTDSNQNVDFGDGDSILIQMNNQGVLMFEPNSDASWDFRQDIITDLKSYDINNNYSDFHEIKNEISKTLTINGSEYKIIIVNYYVSIPGDKAELSPEDIDVLDLGIVVLKK